MKTFKPVSRSNRKPKMFEKGKRIDKIHELIDEVIFLKKYVIIHDKPMHPGVIRNMSLHTLIGYVSHGLIFEAKCTQRYLDWILQQPFASDSNQDSQTDRETAGQTIS